MHVTCQLSRKYTRACTQQLLSLMIYPKLIGRQILLQSSQCWSARFSHPPFCCRQYSPDEITVSALRVAKIIHFCVHNLCVDESNHVTHAFAFVDWVACHPSRYLIGKPIAASSFDTLYKNSLLPLESISSLVLPV